MRAVVFLAVLALTPCDALADFVGRVVNVSDGDTVTVLVENRADSSSTFLALFTIGA